MMHVYICTTLNTEITLEAAKEGQEEITVLRQLSSCEQSLASETTPDLFV